MGLNVNQNQGKPTQAAPVVPTSMDLTLASYRGAAKRLVFKNTLYEAGTVYKVSLEVAEDLLALVSDKGIPMFVRYRPKPKAEIVGETRNAEGVLVKDFSSAKTVEEVSGRQARQNQQDNKPARLEITTQEDIDEMVAAGVLQADEKIDGSGDMTSQSLREGGGVVEV